MSLKEDYKLSSISIFPSSLSKQTGGNIDCIINEILYFFSQYVKELFLYHLLQSISSNKRIKKREHWRRW